MVIEEAEAEAENRVSEEEQIDEGDIMNIVMPVAKEINPQKE